MCPQLSCNLSLICCFLDKLRDVSEKTYNVGLKFHLCAAEVGIEAFVYGHFQSTF